MLCSSTSVIEHPGWAALLVIAEDLLQVTYRLVAYALVFVVFMKRGIANGVLDERDMIMKPIFLCIKEANTVKLSYQNVRPFHEGSSDVI